MRPILVLILLGSLGISLVLVRTIWNVVTVRERVREKEAQVAQLAHEQEELNARLRAATSSAFIERTAREKLGLGKEGETVVVLPDEEFLRNLAPELESEEEATIEESNWKRWWRLFF
ncbi:MAG: septum formation initiator family protein [Patescibacteria group bacterium]